MVAHGVIILDIKESAWKSRPYAAGSLWW